RCCGLSRWTCRPTRGRSPESARGLGAADLRRARVLVLHVVDLGEDARALVVVQRDAGLAQALVELVGDGVTLGAVLPRADLLHHTLGGLDCCLVGLVAHRCPFVDRSDSHASGAVIEWLMARVLIAPDKFKGCLTATEVADALRRGLVAADPAPGGTDVVCLP